MEEIRKKKEMCCNVSDQKQEVKFREKLRKKVEAKKRW
jgi:hypothetical protein